MTLNNKPLFERLNHIWDRGPEKWLTRALQEGMSPEDFAKATSQNWNTMDGPSRQAAIDKAKKTLEDNAKGAPSTNVTNPNASLQQRRQNVTRPQPEPQRPAGDTGRLNQPLAVRTGGVAPIGDGDNPPPATVAPKDTDNRRHAIAGYAHQGGFGKERADRSRSDRIVGRIQQLLERVPHSNASLRDLNTRVTQHSHRLPFLQDVIEEYIDLHDPANKKLFRENSRYTDAQGAIDFLTNDLGMVRGDDGKLTFGEMSHARRAAVGLSPGHGREMNGINYHDRKAFQDEAQMAKLEGVLGGTAQPMGVPFENMAAFHAANMDGLQHLSHEDKKLVWNELAGAVHSYLNGLGAPDSDQGVFKPGSSARFDAQDKDGHTELDELELEDPEMFRENFKTEVPDDTRGLSNLGKILDTRFHSEFLNVPLYGGLEGLTVDHIEGRRTAGDNPEEISTIDRPINLGVEQPHVNQVKSGRSGQYGDDSINKLVNGGSDRGVFDRTFARSGIEEGDEWWDKNEFASWVAERYLMDAFGDNLDPVLDPSLVQERAASSIQFPGLDDLEGLDSEVIEDIMKKQYLDLANLTKAVPRKREYDEDGTLLPQTISRNSWRGGSGTRYGPTRPYLDGFRKAMLVRMLTDTGLNEELLNVEQQQRNRRRRGTPTPEQIDREVAEAQRKARKQWARSNLKVPMQGHSTQYGLGRLNNEEFVDWFRQTGADYLKPLLEREDFIDSETGESRYADLHRALTEQLGGLEQWFPTLETYVNGDQPYEFETDHPAVLRGMGGEWGKMMMRSRDARSKLSEREIAEALRRNRSREDISEPIGETLNLNPEKAL